MPTANPRLSITLSPGLAVTLRELSKLTENSQSAIVGELLEQSRPVFDRMVKVLEQAHRVKLASAERREEMAAKLVGDLEEFQGRLERQLGLGLDVMDGNAADLAAMAERIERRGGRVGGGASRTLAAAPKPAPTPMSNRGVTPHPTKGKPGQKKARRGSL